MNRTILCLLSMVLVAAAEDPGPEGARRLVQAFFAAHFKGDMAFTEASLTSKAGHLAPDLLKACQAKLAEAAAAPDEAPEVNGDPFTDSQEYPDAFQVGKVRVVEGGARVPVTFTWKQGNPPRTLVVVAKNLQSGWRIDDLRYPDGRTLRQLLRPARPGT